ncbi:alcohol dehydrogenase [Apiospora marii]|uniref:alcohol dehydrogenase n=1 Tax=Apiospora marii TaxID=335849 RepID=UPI00312D1BEE
MYLGMLNLSTSLRLPLEQPFYVGIMGFAYGSARIPFHVDWAKFAPMLCAGSTSFSSLRYKGYAAKLGYRVVAITRDGTKETFARPLGAHKNIDCSQGGAKLAVANAPTVATVAPLLKGLGVLACPVTCLFSIASMLQNRLSVQVWSCGHATDSEDTIAFTDMQKIDCMIEKFPLDKANEVITAVLKGDVQFAAIIIM